MPNWCECDLYVELSAETYNEVKKQIGDGSVRLEVDQRELRLERAEAMLQQVADHCRGEATGDGRPAEVIAFDAHKIDLMPAALYNVHLGGTTINGVHVTRWSTDEHGNDIAVDTEAFIKQFGYADWNEWANAHYGCKWPPTSTSVDEIEYGQLVFHFSTPWGPPVPLIATLAKKFPKMNFRLRYFEAGIGFNGMVLFEGGEKTDEQDGKYFGDRGG